MEREQKRDRREGHFTPVGQEWRGKRKLNWFIDSIIDGNQQQRNISIKRSPFSQNAKEEIIQKKRTLIKN